MPPHWESSGQITVCRAVSRQRAEYQHSHHMKYCSNLMAHVSIWNNILCNICCPDGHVVTSTTMEIVFPRKNHPGQTDIGNTIPYGVDSLKEMGFRWHCQMGNWPWKWRLHGATWESPCINTVCVWWMLQPEMLPTTWNLDNALSQKGVYLSTDWGQVVHKHNPHCWQAHGMWYAHACPCNMLWAPKQV